MQPHELATLFQRFRRRGDARALGAVFDATAPELLRTAVHLVGDASLAEDAVQETFLVAIDRRDEYDAKRPLVPWLAGILANQARAARRRRSRDSGPDETVAAQGREPGRRAADREVEELVQAAMDALPEDLRQVLTLNLRHGLAPAEIAHALALLPSTVRTRLQRGRERMRDRLPAEVAASACLVAPALRGLADVRSAVLGRAALVAPTGVVTLATAVVAMKTLLAAALVLGAATLWWSTGSSQPELDSVEAPSAEAVAAPAAHEDVPLATAATAPVRTVEPAQEAVEPAAEPDEAAADPVVVVAPQEHAHEHHDIEFVIVDAYDVPVPDAEIRFRSQRSGLTSWGWSLEPANLVTDNEGRAQFALPERQYSDMPIDSFVFDVLHARFAPLEHEADAKSGTIRLVLEPGVFVIATGWIGARDNIVTDVTVQAGNESKLSPEDWTPLRDGRLACSRLAAGHHVLFLEHVDREGNKWFSQLLEVDFASGEQRELHAELVPALRVEGTLDPSVPRPIENGRVSVAFHNARPTWELPVVFEIRNVDVAPDGTFVVDEAPPQFLDVIAVCDGWSSTPILQEAGEQCTGAGVMTSLRQFAPGALDEPIVVPMQPSASLEITFLDPDGQPLPDAWVVLNPNVRWNSGYTTILFDQGVRARSDVTGRALLHNLVPGTELAQLGHADYQLPAELGGESFDGRPTFELVAGETLRVELQMVAKLGAD